MLRAHLRDLLLQASGSATLLGFLLFDITAFIVSEGTSSYRGDFDYLDFRIPVNLLGEDRNSFGGLSGGGVWRIWVFTADNARGFEAEATPFGVAFHQSQIVDGERSIRCHGPKSLARALSPCYRSQGLNQITPPAQTLNDRLILVEPGGEASCSYAQAPGTQAVLASLPSSTGRA
jgi:hypothetical protein